MTTRSQIGTLRTPSVTRTVRNRSRRPRLAMEVLEERFCLSTFTVSNTLDDGSTGSLRWAVQQANSAGGANTVDFDGSVFSTPKTITLGGSQIELSETTGTMTITGPTVGVTISGNNVSRVFQIDAGVTAALSNLTITGGRASVDGSLTGAGGGLLDSGTATLTNCTFSGNTAQGGNGSGGGDGGIGKGGAIFNNSALTLIDCTLSGNTAQGGNGSYSAGVFGKGGRAEGGAVFNNSSAALTVTNCTFSGNTAQGGNGGISSSGGLWFGGYGMGGAIYDVSGATAALTNCTVSGNLAQGGLDHEFGEAGGVFSNSSVSFVNTIVAQNTADQAPDVNGSVHSLGNNLIGKADSSSGWVASDLKGTSSSPLNPLLAPLANYGGSTLTIALLPGSPAIDAGTSGAGIPTTDQRGQSRVGATDIGAFESQGFTLAAVAGSTPQSATIGTAFANPFTVTVTANNPVEPVDGGVVTFNATHAANGAAPIFVIPNNATLGYVTSFSTSVASGQAAVNAGPNNIAGSYAVNASATGSSVAVPLSLTNAGSGFTSLVVNTTSGALFAGPGLLSLTMGDALANGDGTASTITFDPTVFATPQTITLGGSQLELRDQSGQTTITGPAARVTISGNGLSRVFQIDRGVKASLSGLTITGGNTGGVGGGVYNRGTTTLTNCTLSGNTGSTGGGVYSVATGGYKLTLTSCIISGNSASSAGGLFLAGVSTLTNCTVSDNIAGDAGGGVAASGTNTLTNCTLSGNSAVRGGGLFTRGDGTVTLTNCTLSGNTASVGGGAYDLGTLTLSSCTVSANHASFVGGGLYNYYFSPKPIALANTIVAGNTASFGPDISSGVSGSYNLIGNGSGSFGITDGVGGNRVGSDGSPIDPMLAPLGNNGGLTQTMGLLVGSPAINAGNNALIPGGITTDQRGLPRSIYGTVDIGAVEFASFVVNTTTDEFNLSNSATSLREAVSFVNDVPDQTITFDPAVFATAQTLTLTLGQLELSGTTGVATIEGTAAGLTISGNNASRVFKVDGGVAASFSGLTITGGKTASAGGGVYNLGTATLTNCTISGNSTTGFLSKGAGLYDGGTATLTNCTISGNSSSGYLAHGGGLYLGAGALATLTNCTVSGNSADYGGGGLYGFYGTATLVNTIVAGNSGGNFLSNLAPGSSNNLIDGNALLAPLGNYGGPTQTMPLLPGSPAIDAGTSGAGIPTTDQRGMGRVGATDIGAFESQGFTLTAVPGSTPQTGSVLTAFTNPLALSVTANNPVEPVNGGNVSFVANPASNGASAFLLGGSSTLVIASGQVAIQAMPNNILGSYTVVASTSGESASVPFALTNAGSVLAPLVVNTTSDALYPGAGLLSLREAIAFANDDPGVSSTITFDPTVFATAQSIILTGGPLELSNTTGTWTIKAPAAGLTVSGNNAGRVFQVDTNVTASFSGVTITGGANTVLGGGLYNQGTVTLTNCTITGNRSSFRGGGVYNLGTVTLTNCTVSGNSSNIGGGLFNGGTATLSNTIVARNTSLIGGPPDVSGNVTSLGHNLIGATDGSSGWAPSDLKGTVASPLNPLLAPFSNSSGLIVTFGLFIGSPALDAGDNALIPAGVTTDQRGQPRIFNGTVDIGAFEAQPAIVPSFVVNTTADELDFSSGATSLRDAIWSANYFPGQTITFDPTVFASAQTITLTLGQLELSDTTGMTTITGPTAGVTVSANNLSRVLQIDTGVTASISGLTITGGNLNDIAGGVYNRGTLTLTNCTVTGNSSVEGGGIVNLGTATLTNCTISGNSSTGFGGGLYDGGTATLTNCTISGNSSQFAGGLSVSGMVTLTNCTVTGNSATRVGGAFYIHSASTATLTNCTVSGNSAGRAGGVYNHAGTTTLSNTIVAGNTAIDGPDFVGGASSLGHNLIGKTDGSSGWVASDLTGTVATPLNPLLGSLTNNGGPTATMALQPGSPAIGAGASGAGIPITDQRGYRRAGSVDIGAFQLNGTAFSSQTITFGSLADQTYGDDDFTITAPATSGLPVSFTATGNASVFEVSNVWYVHIIGAGSATITAHQAGDESYAAAPDVAQAFTIAQVALTVTANDASKNFDGAPYSGGNSVNYSGFVNGDTASDLNGTLSYSGDSQGALYAGSYTLTPGGLNSANYTITFQNGTLLINPGTLNVIGTSGTDTIAISQIGSSIHVELNGAPYIGDIPLSSLTGVSISGGAGDDSYDVTAGIGVPVAITAGDGNNSLTAGATNLSFTGGTGSNDATITMAAGAGTVSLSPGSGTIAGTGYSVSLSNTGCITVDANSSVTADFFDSAGDDAFTATPSVAILMGSAYCNEVDDAGSVTAHASSGNDVADLSDGSGSNTFTATPSLATFTGAGLSEKAIGFDSVTANAATGTTDTANLYDASGSNTFTATPTSASFAGSGFSETANGFAKVYGLAASGTNDSANLFDTSGSNTLYQSPTGSSFIGTGFYNKVLGFKSVTATAASGTNDIAYLSDISGSNTFTATPTSAKFTGSGFSNTASAFKKVYATSAAGTTDSANLSDTSGSNAFVAKPTVSSFSGTGFFNQVSGFASVTATAASGTTDTASLYDASGTNAFTATPTSATFSGSGFSETASGFKTVYGYAASGTNDSANLSDTSGSNTLYQSPTGSSFIGTGFNNKVLGFKSVTATAASGANDIAYLSDTSGNNTFTATPTSATFAGSGFSNMANGFKKVYATAAAGTTDTANLSDTSGSNTFTANPTVSTFSGAGFLNQVSGFASVTATAASGTSDTANLSDTSGTNTFTATQTSATFTQGLRSQTANGFKRVNATAAAGTTDSASLSDTSGSNTFTAKPTVSTFSGAGFFNQVSGFASVTATAASGTTDTASLYDASGANTFTASPTSATFSGTGLSETANGFKTVYGFAASGTNDSANLSDTSGSNTLYQSPTGSSFIGAGFYNKVLGFKSVTATAASGTNDIAYLSDISGSNTLTATPTSATFMGSDFANTANGFKKVYATAAAGTTDTANFSDSVAHPGNFTGTPTTSSLSGTGYLVAANGFVAVNATAASSTDVANLFDDALGALYTGSGGKLGTLTGPSYQISITQYGTVNLTGAPGASNKIRLNAIDYVLNQIGTWTPE